MNRPHDFGKGLSRSDKRHAGRTAAGDTAVTIRSRVALAPVEVARIRRSITRSLGWMATRLERLTIRFDDINGPRGGLDTSCRIKAVISGHPSVVVEERAQGATEAALRAAPRLARSLGRVIARQGGKAPAASRPPLQAEPGHREQAAGIDRGSFIGRRVGRSQANLDRALARPEKQRRDAYVDTAAPGRSASDRRAGGISTARRNSKRPGGAMTATLEDSRTRPSRKSGRKSANRTKAGTVLTGRQRLHATSPARRRSQER